MPRDKYARQTNDPAYDEQIEFDKLEKRISQVQEILRDPFPLSIYPQLSPLERNIAKMTVIDGMTAQEISDALRSPKGTVNTYLRMVYKAFGVRREKWPGIVFDRIREVLKDE